MVERGFGGLYLVVAELAGKLGALGSDVSTYVDIERVWVGERVTAFRARKNFHVSSAFWVRVGDVEAVGGRVG
jgi:hypothetical protein